MPIISHNPTTGEKMKEYENCGEVELARKLNFATDALSSWKHTTFQDRSDHLLKLAAHMSMTKDELATNITLETGKPITSARAEIEKCVWCLRYYAENGAEMLKERVIEEDDIESYISFEALGCVLLVMPWNFPYWQVIRAAAPIIMGGNTVVLKHASNVPMCALSIEELFHGAGFPAGVFQTLMIDSKKVEDVIKDPAIAAVSVTGGEKAGRSVASIAGDALKKTVLELGGSDPFIVLDDADIEAAAHAAVKSRFNNNGQSCIAAKRFLIADSVFSEFVEAFKDSLAKEKVGNPLDESVTIGPLATKSALETIEKQVKESVEMGAKIATGGTRLDVGNGYFYAPTILLDVNIDMPVMSEEVFGPVAPLMPFSDIESMIETANGTEYGLGAAIWSNSSTKARQIAKRLECGAIAINGIVASDPRTPFGGVKKSGYGRELGINGILEFTNVKCVRIR